MLDRYGSMGRPMGLRQLMDRMFENAYVMSGEGGPESGVGPAVDVYEEDDNLIVEAQLPGLKPDDIGVNLERGLLTITGKTETEQERRERNYLLREKRPGRFSRSLQLPPMYQTEDCQANYEDGVLRLVFPKAAEARPHRIQIGTGGQRGSQEQQGNGSARDPQAAGGGRRKPEDRA